MKKPIITILFIVFLLNLATFFKSSQVILTEKKSIVSDDIVLDDKVPSISKIDTSVHVNASDIIRELPADLYGSNINFIDNGSGILNPETLEIYNGVEDRFSSMGLSTIRFPGGSLSEKYNWWEGIGPKASRPIGINAYSGGPTTNNYGIDEHYDYCKAIGAVPTITVNFGNGTALAAANWVEYCNVEAPSNIYGWTVNSYKGNEPADPGYFAWLREQNGHTEPYNITNWEVGNEVYNDWTEDYNATQYATRFITYYTAMKAIDPLIKVAAVGYEEPEGIWGTDSAPWNQKVAEIAGPYMDALHIHTYGPVSEDGKSIFFWGSGEVTKTVHIPQAGDYEIWITAEGMNNVFGPYPSVLNNYANLSININSVSQVNFSVVIANPRLYNNTINFPSAGDFTLGIELLNGAAEREVMMWSEVYLENETNQIMVDYVNQTLMYEAVMATANYRGESVANISKILETETGRDDIEVWVTEFNTMYNTLGFGIDQPLKFQSAVAMADIALQFTKNGASSIQQWSSLHDYYFDLMRDARTLADSSMFHTYSLLLEGWGKYLLNSTVICPSFDLETQVGWIPPQNNIPYLDVLPTLNDDLLSLILINKHPTEELNVSLDIEGFNSTQTAILKTVNASSIGAMDLNAPSDFYNYTAGKIGQAIKINSSHDLSYPSYDNVLARRGTIEFWINPEWDGDDGHWHPILSIGQTFQLIKTGSNAIVGVLISDNYTDFSVIYGATNTWGAGEWHYVALTWDLTKNWTLYFDGNKQMTVPLNGIHSYFEQRQSMIIGSSIMNRTINIDASLDEFRISKVVRSDAEILQDFTDGDTSIPLIIDGNTTVLFHFDNSIEDSEGDQQTMITTQQIAYHSSGGYITLPRCSISLLNLQRFIESPTSNHPDNFTTTKLGTETINWTLNDFHEGSKYRVIANNTLGINYVWKDWTSWTKGSELNVPINRSAPGDFLYTIIYNNSMGLFGINDSVLVTIQDELPTSNHPDDFTTTTKGTETINWILSDDFGPGEYHIMSRVPLGTWYLVINWIAWTPDTSLNVPINRTALGTFEYIIQFSDSKGNVGYPDYVNVTVIAAAETDDDDDDSSGDDDDSISEPSAIPGYNLFLIETLLIIVPILLLKNHKNTKSKH